MSNQSDMIAQTIIQWGRISVNKVAPTALLNTDPSGRLGTLQNPTVQVTQIASPWTLWVEQFNMFKHSQVQMF